MDEKLIRRAAIKYRQWMVGQQFRSDSTGAINVINNVIAKSEEMKRWCDRFVSGTRQRVQISLWEPTVEYLGIINHNVYEDIATVMVPELGSDIIVNIKQAMAMLKMMTEKSEVTLLPVQEIIEEIRIISNAWKSVEFRDNKLSVMIEDVVLTDGNEEIDLGHFWIRIDLTDPYDMTIDSVSEVESSGGKYHPHVQNKSLCTGEGGDAIIDAICQGRLEDYLRIIESILRTYNDASPYEYLDQWYNPNHEGEFLCTNCKEWCPEECGYCCEPCNSIYCENCAEDSSSCCECNKWICSQCSTTCKECGETVCGECKDVCCECKNTYCSSCLNECITCGSNGCSSCILSCAYCSESICNECAVTCGGCEANCCGACVDETCSDCQKDICKSCQETCEHCEVLTCQSCSEEHNCLLAEIKT